jgi:hypothetical protein
MEDNPSIPMTDASPWGIDLFVWRLNGVMGLDESAILVTIDVFYFVVERLCCAVHSTYSDGFCMKLLDFDLLPRNLSHSP